MNPFLTAAAVAVLAAAAPAAEPTATEAALSLAFTAPETARVGESIALEATLRNDGAAPADVVESELDARSFDFLVRFGEGRESRFTTWHPHSRSPSTLKKVTLAPGETLTFRREVPALQAGEWTFTPRYHGASAEAVEAGPRTVSVEKAGDARRLIAELKTGQGTIKLEFWPEVAPATSLHMAGLLRDGYFDGILFHRVIRGFMIQGGDPSGDGTGGPGYSIQAEFNDRRHVAGVWSMARQGDPVEQTGQMPRAQFANSAGSQFFICDGDAAALDGRYTAFGKVVEGLDVVREIAATEVGPGNGMETSRPVEPLKIEQGRLVLDGRHE